MVLGQRDYTFKALRKVFKNKMAQWLFKWIHPDIGVGFASKWSSRSRIISGEEDIIFLGEEKEWLVQYCNKKQAEEKRDFFVFGHRHLPLNLPIGTDARYINLGDWITHFTFAEFDGKLLELKKWDS